MDAAGTNKKVTAANLLSGTIQKITTDTTFYVATTGNDTTGDGSSGSPWATLGKALSYIGGYCWDTSTVTVTIQLGDGAYTMTSTTEVAHPCGPGLAIVGENIYSKTMSSVVSSSGSEGAWSLVLQLDDVANIAADDWVIVRPATGGTNPTYAQGFHKVTNVDSGNNRITVYSDHLNETAPSGAVAATVIVIKTRLNYNGCDGILVRNGNTLGFLDKAAIIGDGTANKSGIVAGLQMNASSVPVGSGGYISCGEYVGVSGFGAFGFAALGGSLVANYCAASNCLRGIQAHTGAVVLSFYFTASGNSNIGIWASAGATVYCNYATASGNASHGFQTSVGAAISDYGAQANGNGGAGMVALYSGIVYAEAGTQVNNDTHGLYAYSGGRIYAASSTQTGNGIAATSPAPNTLGNEEGYIDT